VKKYNNSQNIERLPLQEEVFNLDNIANELNIKSFSNPFFQESLSCNRWDFIKNQKRNRYSSKNCPRYLVYLEAIVSNIGNLHPMRLGKSLMNDISAIINIRRLG